MRSTLYKGFLTKHVGWFDNRDNAPGILTSALANDASTLNGASTEGLAVIMEAAFALLVGMAIGFSYDWRVALVAVACTPFMAVGAFIQGRFQAGMAVESNDDYKEANLLVGDTISNYRTIASFAHNDRIAMRYSQYLERPYRNGMRKSHTIGITFGFSQFVQYATFALLFYSASIFLKSDLDKAIKHPLENLNIQQKASYLFIALFSMMFGAFQAGQSQQFGPDLGKAKAAASSIFTYIDTKSRINAVDQP